MLNLTPSHLVRLAVIAISAIGAPCLVVCAEPTAPAESNLEFDSGTKGWQTVLDGVMGGRSTGRISAGEGGTLQFTGELSLENNGGFSQIRTAVAQGLFAGTKGLLMRVKGDGRTYQCDIRSSRARVMAGGYQRLFATKAGEWIEVEIPFDECTFNTFGQRVRDAAPLDPTTIESVGITLSDKKPGDFALEIDWIRPLGAAQKATSNQSLATVGEKANLTTLLALVKAAELELPKGARVTIFAPTNAAFAKLPEEQVKFLTSAAGKSVLQTILKHHIVGQPLEISAVLDRRRLKALSGQTLNVDPNKLTINDAQLVATDVAFESGVVQVIDSVLMPELRTIDEMISADARCSTLRTALDAAGLGAQLGKDNPGPWTLLAPSNNAFAGVPPAALSALLADKSALTAVLAGHVLPTAIRREEMLSQGSARTLMGDGDVTFALNAGVITVADARIEVADIEAANGVIHIIDRVLLNKKSASAKSAAKSDGKSDGKSDANTMSFAQRATTLFELAIERGVPLFNDGDPASCAALYEIAITAVVLLGDNSTTMQTGTTLSDALKAGKANADPKERAWIYRRAMDRALEIMQVSH